jgi:small-conductance mechanosensitive channel
MIALAGCMLLVVAPCAVAQAPREAASVASSHDAQQAGKVQPYPVMLDGKTVIEVGWGYGSFSPPLRAKAISDRLEVFAKDPSLPSVATTNPTDLTVDVMVGDRILASVFEGDSKLTGLSKEVLGQQWKDAFTEAIGRYRQEHSREKILQRVALTVLTIALTMGVLWLLIPATRWASNYLTTRTLEKVQTSKRQSLSLIDTQRLNELIRLGFRTLRLVLSLFTLYLAFHFLFLIFPQTRGLGNSMLQGSLRPVQDFGRAAWRSAPALTFILIIAIVCRYLLHLVRFAFARIGEGKVTIEGFRAAWAPTTQRLMSIAVVMLAALIAYPYIPGSQSQAFKGFSLFVGVLVSLGSTGIVSNMFTGIMLTYMDSFQIGDFIQIGETQGYVESTSLFVTRLRTRQQRVVTIPNSMVLNSQITNYSAAGETTSLSVTAGIGYDTPWRQVEAMLLQAARKTGGVREAPTPFVLEGSLNSFDITYELTVFLASGFLVSAVGAELNRKILDEFNLYGVQIMTPAYVADPAKPAVVAEGDWFTAPAKKDGQIDS